MFCVKCGTEVAEGASFCIKCGNAVQGQGTSTPPPPPSSQPQASVEIVAPTTTMGADEKHCSSCGAVIKKMAELCPKCGVRQIATAGSAVRIPKLITSISKKEKLVSTFWIIIASFQAIVVFFGLVALVAYEFDDSEELIIGILIIAVISVLNFVAGFKGLKFAKEMLDPDSVVPIVESYEKLASYIATIVYNSAIFLICISGIEDAYDLFLIFVMSTAVAASIYDLVAIRNFAMENREKIEKYEEQRG